AAVLLFREPERRLQFRDVVRAPRPLLRAIPAADGTLVAGARGSAPHDALRGAGGRRGAGEPAPGPFLRAPLGGRLPALLRDAARHHDAEQLAGAAAHLRQLRRPLETLR